MQKKKRGRPRKVKEMLKEPIKTLKDIPQEFKSKKRVSFWAWLFPKIWK